MCATQPERAYDTVKPKKQKAPDRSGSISSLEKPVNKAPVEVKPQGLPPQVDMSRSLRKVKYDWQGDGEPPPRSPKGIAGGSPVALPMRPQSPARGDFGGAQRPGSPALSKYAPPARPSRPEVSLYAGGFSRRPARMEEVPTAFIPKRLQDQVAANQAERRKKAAIAAMIVPRPSASFKTTATRTDFRATGDLGGPRRIDQLGDKFFRAKELDADAEAEGRAAMARHAAEEEAAAVWMLQRGGSTVVSSASRKSQRSLARSYSLNSMRAGDSTVDASVVVAADGVASAAASAVSPGTPLLGANATARLGTAPGGGGGRRSPGSVGGSGGDSLDDIESLGRSSNNDRCPGGYGGEFGSSADVSPGLTGLSLSWDLGDKGYGDQCGGGGSCDEDGEDGVDGGDLDGHHRAHAFTGHHDAHSGGHDALAQDLLRASRRGERRADRVAPGPSVWSQRSSGSTIGAHTPRGHSRKASQACT